MEHQPTYNVKAFLESEELCGITIPKSAYAIAAAQHLDTVEPQITAFAQAQQISAEEAVRQARMTIPGGWRRFCAAATIKSRLAAQRRAAAEAGLGQIIDREA